MPMRSAVITHASFVRPLFPIVLSLSLPRRELGRGFLRADLAALYAGQERRPQEFRVGRRGFDGPRRGQRGQHRRHPGIGHRHVVDLPHPVVLDMALSLLVAPPGAQRELHGPHQTDQQTTAQ